MMAVRVRPYPLNQSSKVRIICASRYVSIVMQSGAVPSPHGKGRMNYDTPQGNERFALEF